MPVPQFVQNLLEGLSNLNPQAAAASDRRKQVAEMMKERLFNEQNAQTRNSMEQQRLDMEKSHWDDQQQQSRRVAQHQMDTEDRLTKQQEWQERLGISQGLASGAFRSPVSVPGATPTQPTAPVDNPSIADIPNRTLATPAIQENNPAALTAPFTGQTVIPTSPQEQAQNAADLSEGSFQDRLKAFGAASPDNQKFLSDPDNMQKLQEFHLTGGHFFPQQKADPIKDLQQQYVDEDDPDKQNAILKQIGALTKAQGKGGGANAADATNRDPSNFMNSHLTEQAARQQALLYNLTGDVTNFGMMGAPAKTAIINYASELGGSDSNPALNKMAYKANQTTLDQQLKTFSNITSYENTGKGNIIRALDLAKNIPNSISPWLNKPMRDFENAALGDENLAAFRTALLTARNEYARITTGGPTMSGVVSDTARAEVDKALPENATVGQLLASGKVAVLDMEQRKHDSANTIDFTMRNAGGGAKGLLDLANRTPDYAKIDNKTGQSPAQSGQPVSALPGNVPPQVPVPTDQVTVTSPSGQARVYSLSKDYARLKAMKAAGAKLKDASGKDVDIK